MFKSLRQHFAKDAKILFIILAVTVFARVAIFAIPVVGLYFGLNSETIEQENEK